MTARTTPLRLMSTLAVEVAFRRSILPEWQGLGQAIETDWAPTTVLMRRILEGARGDVVVMIDAQMEDLASRGIVAAETITPVAQANFGIAVPAGSVHPDISTPEAFLAAVTAARSVAYSLTGASGLHFVRILRNAGLGAVLDRATSIPAGFTAEQLRTGAADLAVQQISELMSVEGIEVVGPFPGRLQQPTDFCAAAFAEAPNPGLARHFLAHLQTERAGAAYRAGGLVPRLRQPAA